MYPAATTSTTLPTHTPTATYTHNNCGMWVLLLPGEISIREKEEEEEVSKKKGEESVEIIQKKLSILSSRTTIHTFDKSEIELIIRESHVHLRYFQSNIAWESIVAGGGCGWGYTRYHRFVYHKSLGGVSSKPIYIEYDSRIREEW